MAWIGVNGCVEWLLKPTPLLEAHKRNVLRHGAFEAEAPPLEAQKRDVLRHGAFEAEALQLEAQKTERQSKRHTQSPDIDPI